MKLGVLVESEEDLTWDRWRHVVAIVERLGFESLWISDHLQSAHAPERAPVDSAVRSPEPAHLDPAVRSPEPSRLDPAVRSSEPARLDPWLALAVAAAETRRIRLGTLVSPITFYAPALLARMAESLDLLSNGRFVLGLGLGWNAAEHRAHGMEMPPVAERARRLVEAIEQIRRELRERKVPLLIGGAGESTLPIVARYADEWNVTTSAPELFQEKRARLATLCGEIGRDPTAIQRSIATGFVIGRDTPEVDERRRRAEQVVPTQGWIAGTPSEIVSSLGALAQAGVQRAIFGHYLIDDDDALEMVANTVLPRLGDNQCK